MITDFIPDLIRSLSKGVKKELICLIPPAQTLLKMKFSFLMSFDENDLQSYLITFYFV